MKPNVGLLSFADPRAVKGIDELNRRDKALEADLARFLADARFDVIRPLSGRLVNSRKLADEASRKLLAADVDCILAGCWKWTDPMLAVDVARRVNRPIMLVGDDAPEATSLGCMAAVGAALWEIAPNAYAARHGRALGDRRKILDWVRGMSALARLRRKTILLWGGSYCLKMAHLDDDPSRLKSLLVGDILVQDQYELIARAEELLKRDTARVSRFVAWLKSSCGEIVYDKKMGTPKALARQTALYLAARDLLQRYAAEEGVEGVSVKCQPAISEQYGVTACLLPAFLPFDRDAEGKRPVIATACEGDIKGLITSLLLQYISGGTPAGFGDIRTLDVNGRELFVISNCGAASVHYASSKHNGLKGVSLRGQCQGASGFAVGYLGQSFGAATIARLVRREGAYSLQWAVGDSVTATPAVRQRFVWGDSWPISMFDIRLNRNRFVDIMASNHYSFIPGNAAGALRAVCDTLAIPMENISG